jgi:hypothetical protein
MRVAGCYKVAVSNLAVYNKPTGIIVDSAIIGGSIAWAYHASQDVVISNVTIDNTGSDAVSVLAQNVTSASAAAMYTFGVQFNNISVQNSANWAFTVQGNGSTTSRVDGVHFSNCRARATGALGMFFSSLRNSSFNNITLDATAGANIEFTSQDAAGGAAPSFSSNVMASNLYNNGSGAIAFRDMRDIHLGLMRAGAGGITYSRVANRVVASTTTTP